MAWIKKFSDPELAADEVGGKFIGLQILHHFTQEAESCYVPRAVCWTTSATRNLLGDWDDQPTTNSLASELIRRISENAFAKEISTELEESLAPPDLSYPVAVRSSADVEDSDRYSFAGQFDTILGVSGYNAVEKAIRKCIASSFSNTVLQYRARVGLELVSSGMAVVIQSMVNSRTSGVMLSIDPRNHKTACYVEAVRGLGEILVGGMVNPEKSVMMGSQISRIEVSEAKSALELSQGIIQSRELSIIERSTAVLTDDELLRLTQLERKMKEKLGFPIDMEFAFDKRGRLALLQVRPLVKENCA